MQADPCDCFVIIEYGKNDPAFSKAVLEKEVQCALGSLHSLGCLWWLEHNHHVGGSPDYIHRPLAGGLANSRHQLDMNEGVYRWF